MKYFAGIVLTLFLPLATHAAPATLPTFFGGSSILVSTSSPANVYASGFSVTVTSATKGDVSVLAGSGTVAGPVGEDALILGGSASLQAPVTGDARLIGGTVNIGDMVSGDVVALGGSVTDTGGSGRAVFIVGGEVSLVGGASGPVTIYGNNVALGGTFANDVRVIAGGRVTLKEGTVIKGMLSYESPEQALIPDSALVGGGIHYTGASYLPTSEQSRALLFASVGVFLFVRFLASIILAGLVAGLFPRLANDVASRAFDRRFRSVLLTTLLGFAILVATPVLLFLLALTFVGLGIAFLIAAAYVLLGLLAFVFSGIVVGNFIARKLLKRSSTLWHDGAIGMLVLSVFGLIPYLGTFVSFVIMMFAEGALAVLFFQTAFQKAPEEDVLL